MPWVRVEDFDLEVVNGDRIKANAEEFVVTAIGDDAFLGRRKGGYNGEKPKEISIRKDIPCHVWKKLKRWRAPEGYTYNYFNDAFSLRETVDNRGPEANERFKLGNYFKTSVQCEDAADEFEKLFLTLHEKYGE